jgi:hypothetical protein
VLKARALCGTRGALRPGDDDDVGAQGACRSPTVREGPCNGASCCPPCRAGNARGCLSGLLFELGFSVDVLSLQRVPAGLLNRLLAPQLARTAMARPQLTVGCAEAGLS